MNWRPSLLALTALVLVIVAIVVTRRTPEKRGPRIFTEMADSLALEPQRTSDLLAPEHRLRPNVPGTVPRGYTPFQYEAGDEGKQRAGVDLSNPYPPSLATLERGQQVYRNSCQHCHGPAGRGDGEVAKRVSTFAMSIVGKATADSPDGEIFHVLTHGQNNMPPHAVQVTPDDRWKLIHYLRDLQHAEERRLARMGITLKEDPRKATLVSAAYGREIFDTNCATCHGPEGRRPEVGVPTLNSPRVLAVADDDYYRDIITHGKGGTDMPAWGKVLTPTQIQSLTAYVRSWTPTETLPAQRPVPREGGRRVASALYRANCAPCHGVNGEGGIGSSLRSPSFLALASDAFLKNTILHGRKHTAMPAASGIGSDEIEHILSYIRGWSTPEHTFEEVERLLPNASSRIGERLYEGRCASCHGQVGEGGIGSRLSSPSFLAMASDRYLYDAIVKGRPGTAMPGWHFLQTEDVADIISFLRTWHDGEKVEMKARTHAGRPEFGELLFRQACASCHGLSGEGASGPQIANRVFLDSASDAFLWRTVAYGKDGTSMKGFLKGTGALMSMSEEDIDHVVAYLRTLRIEDQPDPPMAERFTADLALGRHIYEEKASCAECHGFEGEGASGPAIGNRNFLDVASDGYLAGTLVLGRENTEMLSFSRGGNVDLNPGEIEAVVAYVRSFESLESQPPRLFDNTAAAIATGADLYRANCASCHGSDGKGPRNNSTFDGYAPSLNNAQFLDAVEDGFLLATIAMGRPGTPMRAFGTGAGGISDLTAKEIRNIVAFIRSWENPQNKEETP